MMQEAAILGSGGSRRWPEHLQENPLCFPPARERRKNARQEKQEVVEYRLYRN